MNAGKMNVFVLLWGKRGTVFSNSVLEVMNLFLPLLLSTLLLPLNSSSLCLLPGVTPCGGGVL